MTPVIGSEWHKTFSPVSVCLSVDRIMQKLPIIFFIKFVEWLNIIWDQFIKSWVPMTHAEGQ